MRRSISLGIILILLGSVFLLDNLGLVNINVWGVFWPAVLIWFGLQLLISSRRRGSSQDEHLAIPIKGIEEAHVRVNFGSGELHIHGNTGSEALLEGSFGAGVEHDVTEKGDAVDVGLRLPPGTFLWGPAWWKTGNDRNWSFGLNKAIPLTLDVNTGASKAVLDLKDLHLTELRLQTGASDTTITLPAHVDYTQVRAETGVASVNFQVPEGVAACIRASGGLSRITVDQDRFPRRGDRYESADYASATNKVEIDVTVGLGSADIR